MTTLLIDNHDSNTFNLFQLLAIVEGCEPEVVRNDETDWTDLDVERFSKVVISPGPGRPERPRDFGVSSAALAAAELPMLGVCLGHQGLVLAHGGTLGPAPRPMHGRRSRIFHSASELFEGMPQGFMAVRYHSLAVHEPLPGQLEVIARTASGTVMAVRHRERPHWGVQFHPESVATEDGERLIRNFCRLAAAARAPRPAPAPTRRRPPRPGRRAAVKKLEVVTCTVPDPPDSESAFVDLYGEAPTAFWLDSSMRDPSLARYSYMGGAGGPLSSAREPRRRRRGARPHSQRRHGAQGDRLLRLATGRTRRSLDRGSRLLLRRLRRLPGLRAEGGVRQPQQPRAHPCRTRCCCSPTA